MTEPEGRLVVLAFMEAQAFQAVRDATECLAYRIGDAVDYGLTLDELDRAAAGRRWIAGRFLATRAGQSITKTEAAAKAAFLAELRGSDPTVTEPDARRIVLALMTAPSFDLVADVTAAVAGGRAAPEDFGFTPAEVARAYSDRAWIAGRYSGLKRRNSFTAGAITAKTEFLVDMKGETDG